MKPLTRDRSSHCFRSTVRVSHLLGALAIFLLAAATQGQQSDADAAKTKTSKPIGCLPSGDGFLRARLSGSMNAELDWTNNVTECTGSIRPANDGLRLRFRHVDSTGAPLVILFGITGLKEGAAGKALPVNVTVIREGGDIFATQGDQRCTIDDVTQQPLAGIPLRKRSYRVVARGFCTQPARALKGDGSILITRFDYAGRVDFDSDEETESPTAST